MSSRRPTWKKTILVWIITAVTVLELALLLPVLGLWMLWQRVKHALKGG